MKQAGLFSRIFQWVRNNQAPENNFSSMPRRQRLERLGCIIFAGLLLILQAFPAHAESDNSREYTIKAGFIYNFTKFIQWPEVVQKSIENQGLKFCIAGEDPFGKALDGFSKALEENNRDLVITKGVSPKQSATCHILFIDSSVSGQLEQYLDNVKEKPTLVISDIPGFGEKGVAINFVIRRNKTRFEINPYAVKKSGIKISSELLKLGILVGKEEKR